jgi:hypothetical protein
MYDLFTPFTFGLVYLMYRSFEQVPILRPEALRPGSSKRFMVCKQFKGGKACMEVANYLAHCHSTDFGCHVKLIISIPFVCVGRDRGFYLCKELKNIELFRLQK